MPNQKRITECISKHPEFTFSQIATELNVSVSEICKVVSGQINEEIITDSSRVELSHVKE